MPSQLIDPTDLAFQLFDVADADRLTSLPRFKGQDRETYTAILDAARILAAEKFRNHYRLGDRNEPHLVDGKVVLPREIADGVRAFHEAGFASAHADEAFGGLQLPWTVVQAAFAHFQAANIATVAYPFLTIAAANLIDAHGAPDQKERYLPALFAGRFFGTMALSETQAGSSLSDIRTQAAPLEGNLYSIRGEKMWTSGGEHEMAENIVHMVLARTPGAPNGVKGLSLFIVPRYRMNEDGGVGASNDVVLAGLNHKMGYRGTVNTFLKFGESDGCIGELVGEPNRGLSYMFHMMNEARIGVGMGAGMLAYTGYMESLSYAQERRQGRPPGSKNPGSMQVSLLAHADIRRMLVLQKAIAEGCLSLALICARWVDDRRWADDEVKRARANLLLEIVTPVLKAWFSDAALRANEAAIQILGGYGYTRDFPVEQIYRDNRLNPIHEGTNGIQAIDLLGRKVSMQAGAAFTALLEEIETVCRQAGTGFPDQADALLQAAGKLKSVTSAHLGKAGGAGIDWALAPAQAYMDAMGGLVLAWIWLRQALAAERHPDPAFRTAKIETCRYVFTWELPKALLALDQIGGLKQERFPYPSADIFGGAPP